jgi:hypothetical protein
MICKNGKCREVVHSPEGEGMTRPDVPDTRSRKEVKQQFVVGGEFNANISGKKSLSGRK